MFIIHFQSFHTKIKGQPLLSNWIEKVFQQHFSEEVIPAVWEVNRSLKAHFPQRTHLYVCQNRNKCLTVPSYLPQSGSKKFDTSLSAFQESQRGEEVGWGADMLHKKTPNSEFFLLEEDQACTSDPRAGKVATLCVCVCLSFGADLCACWPQRWQSPGKP